MELKTYFAQDAAGNIISSAIVNVFLQGTTTLATGLTRADGTPLENPFAADGAGRIQFRAPDGYYDVQVSAGPGIIQTLTIQCVDYSGAKAAADRADVSAEQAQDALNSITGINNNFEQNSREQWRRSLAEAGLTLVSGSFEEGATANSSTDAIWHIAGGQCYTWDGAFPKVVHAGTDPTIPGSGYIMCLNQLVSAPNREALRRSYATAGYNLVDGSFESGGTLVNANDVLLQERTGKAFSGPAGIVVAGTNPITGDYKVAGIYKHFSSFYEMIASTEEELPIDSVCSTGGTMWVRSAAQTALTSFTPISAICGDDFGITAGGSVSGQTISEFLTVAYTYGCRGYFRSVGEVTVTSNIELLSIDKNLVVDWTGIKLFGESDGVSIRLSSTEIPSSLLADMARGSTVVRVAGAVEGDLIYIEDNEKYETQWNFNSRELFIAGRESGSDMKVDRPSLFRHLIANNVKVNRYKPVRLIFNNFKMEHFNNRDNSSFVNIGSVSFGTSSSWFRGFYMPVFSGDVETSGGSSYELIACYMPRVGNVVANRCQYPISPVAGTYDTVIDSITASFCRHAASPTTWFNKFEVKKCVGYNNFSTMDSHAGFDAKWRNVFATEEYDMPNIRCIGGELTDIEIVASLGTTPAEDPQIGIVTFTGDASMHRDWIATNVALNYKDRTDDIFALPWQADNVYYENINCMGGFIRCANTASKIKTVTLTNINACVRLVGDCGNLKTLINNRVIPDDSFYMYENAPNAKKTTLWEVNCGSISGASANKVLKIFDNYGTSESQNLLVKVKSCSSYNNGGSVAYIEKTYLVNHKLSANSSASISGPVDEIRINGVTDSDISLNVTLTNSAGYTQSPDINAHFFELTIATTTVRPNNVFGITVEISKLN